MEPTREGLSRSNSSVDLATGTQEAIEKPPAPPPEKGLSPKDMFEPSGLPTRFVPSDLSRTLINAHDKILRENPETLEELNDVQSKAQQAIDAKEKGLLRGIYNFVMGKVSSSFAEKRAAYLSDHKSLMETLDAMKESLSQREPDLKQIAQLHKAEMTRLAEEAAKKSTTTQSNEDPLSDPEFKAEMEAMMESYELISPTEVSRLRSEADVLEEQARGAQAQDKAGLLREAKENRGLAALMERALNQHAKH